MDVTSVNQLVDSQIFEKGVSRLASELDPHIYSAYIRPLRFSSFDPDNSEVEIIAPSMFIRTQVDRNFRDKLVKALSDESGACGGVNVKLSVAPTSVSGSAGKVLVTPRVVIKKIPGLAEREVSRSAVSQNTASFIPHGLNPRYTFSSFVVGNSNQFCHAAARRVAEAPGRDYNPLFIYGGVGLGKTHLLHAIGNEVLAKNPTAKVAYMSSESFTNQLIQALRNSTMDEFKSKMRSIDVLLIDDIQFMSGKERTQEEFFHTFNTLYAAKHQIVLSSDKIPQEIAGMEERLHTRFSWGLAADLQAPDFETRVAILRRKAALENFTLPEKVAQMVAERVSSNVRELEGALTRLHAVSSLQCKEISEEMAFSALRYLFQPKSVNLSVDDIKKAVAEHFQVKVSDLVSKRRTRNLSFPRHIAMYLCRKHTTASYPDIGMNFGGRDHSSVIHASNVVSAKISSDMSVKDIVGKIEKRLIPW